MQLVFINANLFKFSRPIAIIRHEMNEFPVFCVCVLFFNFVSIIKFFYIYVYTRQGIISFNGALAQ